MYLQVLSNVTGDPYRAPLLHWQIGLTIFSGDFLLTAFLLQLNIAVLTMAILIEKTVSNHVHSWHTDTKVPCIYWTLGLTFDRFSFIVGSSSTNAITSDEKCRETNYKVTWGFTGDTSSTSSWGNILMIVTWKCLNAYLVLYPVYRSPVYTGRNWCQFYLCSAFALVA